jgi:hypothetical protein
MKGMYRSDLSQNQLVPIQNPSTQLGNLECYKTLDFGVVTSTSVADGLYGYNVQLQNFTEYASYSDLYDQYRIAELLVKVLPVTQAALPASAPGYSFLNLIPDFDDDTPPTSFTLSCNYMSSSIVPPGMGTSCNITPSCRVGASGQEVMLKAPWHDCTNTTIKHFGWKIAVKQSSSTNVNSWYVFCRVRLQFKNNR